ncbi:zinc carboxypeptidase family protein (macronuclear) [Tetrahymena thermophila SB210]|uniref:Zinc carboxypeptidase family protein n=1 Tax=Tetrahymena thermophila (strain SB210) TaxID=312017 RepID=Q23RN2_TETTS|nr:zinc carboxypeptidase family protein [Tetrahymena thermophila SB210]EAR99205.1 zinc carboxypeptidase family protein [Tetrahymena thermophila SB210]|eukprot:XP_001019450.1 zinc carboxypeptidase family protein [Tetrahymena thermophila SB210]
MDKTSFQALNCRKHQKKHLQFIQVNDVLNQQSQSKELFYCSSCFNHDLEFKSINFLMIDQILQEAETNIIPKWPPVNNYQLIQDLIDFTSKESELNYEKQIIDFFNELKEQLLAKIDIIQKKMINETHKYPIDNNQIIKKYQEISNILQFKQLLMNEQGNNLQEHSTLCRQFIQKIESQKDKNTELLQSLLTQSNQLQKSFDLEYPIAIKQQLFTLVDSISFFNQDFSQVNLNQSNQGSQQSRISTQNSNKITADLIMKLISNKSNFCSDQFINELNLSLQKLNPLLQYLKLNNIFKENKEPIEFSKISEEKLNLVGEYVKHSIQLTSDQQYENSIKNKMELKQINEIMNSKMNFLNQESIQKFEKWTVEMYPFLKQMNFQNFIKDKNKFDLFKNLGDNNFNELIIAAQKGFFYLNLNLVGTEYSDGQRIFAVSKNKNSEYIITKINSENWTCCISSLDLQKDLKYVFRIQLEKINEGNEFVVGLMRNSISQNKGGWDDYLSCQLKNQSEYLKISDNYGIINLLKGVNEFQVKKDCVIEIRVCLKDKLLEMTDYPNYQYKLGLEDKHKPKLEQYKDLRFYLSFLSSDIQISLKDAEIVNKFKD